MRALPFLLATILAGCAPAEPSDPRPVPPPSSDSEQPQTPPGSTRVLDRAAAERLLGASGITLQWISWDYRGSLSAWQEAGTIRLRGSQDAADGKGRLELDGEVREIGSDYFLFDGRIAIRDTPDRGRRCEADKLWRFAITQNRPYWRLREFEWCDGLTDYVDIYF